MQQVHTAADKKESFYDYAHSVAHKEQEFLSSLKGEQIPSLPPARPAYSNGPVGFEASPAVLMTSEQLRAFEESQAMTLIETSSSRTLQKKETHRLIEKKRRDNMNDGIAR
ncbi:hypothetical protein HDU91_005052 [Kappamyces sp. JEL0680]|nr:hypothetical protein HDU91_005052 [Kappamyces sp. JEL0680]